MKYAIFNVKGSEVEVRDNVFQKCMFSGKGIQIDSSPLNSIWSFLQRYI